ncbi:MAG: type II toxin-antitoxin system RelE/ParE family toxin [Synergistaceae bacterium]|jgi:plasmid stabilization system protein ParE|nr:type II toxin-antitoxin system RelE/ParE family toxin [Synergistaceae bacterium]
MPYLVIWLPQAVEDVRNAFRFLASKDEGAAKTATEAILKQADILEKFPDAGKMCECLPFVTREKQDISGWLTIRFPLPSHPSLS